MKKVIRDILDTIAKLEDISIIYACESGSRAWGFSSENSDYDVRFIYVRPKHSYITIQARSDCIDVRNGTEDTKKVINKSNDDYDIDLCGWDISKAIYLISKGNPVLAEWMQSPIVYFYAEPVLSWLRELSNEYYRSRAGIYHYEHMARRNFNKYIKNVSGPVLLKKYLYVCRPLYACGWIEAHGTPAPMEFERLYRDEKVTSFFDTRVQNMLPEVVSLVERKRSGEELSRGAHIQVLDEACEKLLDFYGDYGLKLKEEGLIRVDYDRLDGLLRKIIDRKENAML